MSTDKPFQIVLENGVLVIRFLRKPTLQEYYHAIDAVSNRDHKRRRLWDHSFGLDWSTNAIESLGRYAKSKLISSGDKVAVYAPDDLTFGLFRINGVYREEDRVEYEVFRDFEDAVEWLKKEND